MAAPKILVIPGSLRAKSYNVRLAALATKELMLADADVTRISLLDYPLPIYDADSAETAGPPPNALKLKQLMSAHQGVFIASPEYNASITPLIKNTIDWISAVRERGDPPLAAYQNRVFALGGASPGRSGATRLPGTGDRGAGDGAERRTGLRRDGRAQGCARREPAQGRGAQAHRDRQAVGMRGWLAASGTHEEEVGREA